MYLHIARSGLTKPLRPIHEFYFTSVRVTSVQKLQNMTSAKHFSEFTQLFLVYICTCVIILKVTRFYLNLERKATLRLHRLCLSIHVFHADWYTKKRGLFHINKVKKVNTHIIGTSMDSFIDKASQVQTGRDISTKHLSF